MGHSTSSGRSGQTSAMENTRQQPRQTGTFSVRGVDFDIRQDGTAQIQVGSNWGNRVETDVENAREVFRAIQQGRIEVQTGAGATFETIREIETLIKNRGGRSRRTTA